MLYARVLSVDQSSTWALARNVEKFVLSYTGCRDSKPSSLSKEQNVTLSQQYLNQLKVVMGVDVSDESWQFVSYTIVYYETFLRNRSRLALLRIAMFSWMFPHPGKHCWEHILELLFPQMFPSLSKAPSTGINTAWETFENFMFPEMFPSLCILGNIITISKANELTIW